MRKLSEEEVNKRLQSYDNEGVTDELYDFGKMLVNELIERNNKLDTKAASMAAYAIGIITLLTSTYAGWSKVHYSLGIPFPLLGALTAFVALIFAVLGLTLQRYEGFSQSEWLHSELLNNREQLRKYHILTMWGVLNSHESVSEKKADRISKAQRMLVITTIILLLSMLDATVVL